MIGVLALPWPKALFAGEPSIFFVANLGPGNEDVAASLTECAFSATADTKAISQASLDLSRRDLRGMRIYSEFDAGDALHNVKFDDANLSCIGVADVAFVHCSFRRAILRKLNLEYAIAADCDLTDADIAGATLGVTKEQLLSTANYKSKDLSSTIFKHCDLRGVSLAGFNLRGAVFDRYDLAGCDFADADIRSVTIICRRKREKMEPGLPELRFTKEQLYATKSYRTRNLEETLFAECDFCGVNFSKQNLGKFSDCVLADADFTDACFSGCEARWYCPLLEKRGCGFERCDLSAKQFYATRQYRLSALPPSFVLEKMALKGWDFRRMDLQGVSFTGSTVEGVKLEDARGGLFNGTTGLTIEDVKTMWNWKTTEVNGIMERSLSLPADIHEALLAEKKRTDRKAKR